MAEYHSTPGPLSSLRGICKVASRGPGEKSHRNWSHGRKERPRTKSNGTRLLCFALKRGAISASRGGLPRCGCSSSYAPRVGNRPLTNLCGGCSNLLLPTRLRLVGAVCAAQRWPVQSTYGKPPESQLALSHPRAAERAGSPGSRAPVRAHRSNREQRLPAQCNRFDASPDASGRPRTRRVSL
jgi:hypothetical protein